MSLSLCFTPSISPTKQTHLRIPLFKTNNTHFTISKNPIFTNSRFRIRCKDNGNVEKPASFTPPDEPEWQNWLAKAASLYPLYVTAGAVVAFLKPSAFSWFVKMGPASYSLTLGFIMLAMGITLELKDLLNLFMQRPLSVSILAYLLMNFLAKFFRIRFITGFAIILLRLVTWV